jgi:hypothetical protein
MEPNETVVKADSGSTSESTATVQESQTDVKQVSDSSAVQTDVKKEPTLQDVVADVLKKHEKKPDSSTEKKEEEKSAVLEKNATEEKTEAKKDEKKEEPKPVAEEDAKFSPRANERIRELANKKTEFESKVKEYEPIVQRMQGVERYCQTNNISTDEYKQSLELAALVKTNPQEAVKRLQGLVDTIRQSTGEALPPDLQKRVDDGLDSIETAKETAKLRLAVNGNKTQQERQQVEQQQRTQQELTQSLNSWSETRKLSDPDFKPKAGDTAPDGKYELVFSKFLYYWNTKPVQTIQQAVALLDQAYNDVNNSIKSFIPTPKPRRTVSSNGASTQQQQEQIDVSKPGWARKIAAGLSSR